MTPRLHHGKILAAMCLAAGSACAGRRAGTDSTRPDAIAMIADKVSALASAVAGSRATLDSAVAELHGAAGDTSVSAAARSARLRTRVRSLDSTYRAHLSEFIWTVNASTSGVLSLTSRFPVNAAPVPLLQGFADGTNWMTLSPIVQEVGASTAHVVVVPRGFVTDLASIPQPLQLLRGREPNTGRYAVAAVVHDYLYWTQDCTRVQADNIMAIAMAEAGVPALERRLVYEAVRRFGQAAWDGNRRARRSGLVRTIAPPHDQVPLTGSWAQYREWLRATRAPEGREYGVQQSVCAMADSLRGSN